jgi:hypothetical protein
MDGMIPGTVSAAPTAIMAAEPDLGGFVKMSGLVPSGDHV